VAAKSASIAQVEDESGMSQRRRAYSCMDIRRFAFFFKMYKQKRMIPTFF
jgi:hypothetical protein